MRIAWVDTGRYGSWTAALLFVQLWHYVGLCIAFPLALIQFGAIAAAVGVASRKWSHHLVFAASNTLWAGSFLLLFFAAYYGGNLLGVYVPVLRPFDFYFLFVAALSAAIAHLLLYYTGDCPADRQRLIFQTYAGPLVTLLGLLFFGSAMLARVSTETQLAQIELYQAASLVVVAMLACSVFVGLPLRGLAADDV